MGLSVAAMNWVLLGLKIFLALIPPSIIVWLVNEVSAHSLYLYGQRTSDVDNARVTYRFAVQNNEDVALSEHTLRVQILDEDGGFEDGPSVYAGCNMFTPVMAPDKKCWSMTFQELPPYDTWTIDCTMNALSRNVRLEIGEAEARLAGNTLHLAGDQVSMLVGRTTTEWWWGILGLLLGLVVYMFSTVFILGFEAQDWWFVSAIVAFTLVLYWLGRAFSPRLAPPITQGYWNAVKTPFDSDLAGVRGGEAT
jgi:hypothetical protein